MNAEILKVQDKKAQTLPETIGLAASVYTSSWVDEGLKTLSNVNARP